MQTLTPKALAEEWAKNKTRPVYYLCGEETAMKEAALKRLEGLFRPESFNFSVRDAETTDMAQALDEAQTSPMLAEVRFVAIKHVEKIKKEPLIWRIPAPAPACCCWRTGREKNRTRSPRPSPPSAPSSISPRCPRARP